jgi:phasin family protein
MASKPQPQPQPPSLIDMFMSLGRDLRLPSIDVEHILDHHRKNLEALEQSARASAAGPSSVLAKQREAIEAAFREFSDFAQTYRVPGDPKEVLAKHADFARKSFETAVKNTSDVAEIVRKSGSASAEILRRRMHEAMDEVRHSYEEHK